VQGTVTLNQLSDCIAARAVTMSSETQKPETGCSCQFVRDCVAADTTADAHIAIINRRPNTIVDIPTEYAVSLGIWHSKTGGKVGCASYSYWVLWYTMSVVRWGILSTAGIAAKNVLALHDAINAEAVVSSTSCVQRVGIAAIPVPFCRR
jgi:hypothetical protein